MVGINDGELPCGEMRTVNLLHMQYTVLWFVLGRVFRCKKNPHTKADIETQCNSLAPPCLLNHPTYIGMEEGTLNEYDENNQEFISCYLAQCQYLAISHQFLWTVYLGLHFAMFHFFFFGA